LAISKSNKIVCGPGAPDPAGGADGAPSDPLVDWDRVRYTVPIFLPLDAFGVLVMDRPKI